MPRKIRDRRTGQVYSMPWTSPQPPSQQEIDWFLDQQTRSTPQPRQPGVLGRAYNRAFTAPQAVTNLASRASTAITTPRLNDPEVQAAEQEALYGRGVSPEQPSLFQTAMRLHNPLGGTATQRGFMGGALEGAAAQMSPGNAIMTATPYLRPVKYLGSAARAVSGGLGALQMGMGTKEASEGNYLGAAADIGFGALGMTSFAPRGRTTPRPTGPPPTGRPIESFKPAPSEPQYISRLGKYQAAEREARLNAPPPGPSQFAQDRANLEYTGFGGRGEILPDLTGPPQPAVNWKQPPLENITGSVTKPSRLGKASAPPKPSEITVPGVEGRPYGKLADKDVASMAKLGKKEALVELANRKTGLWKALVSDEGGFIGRRPPKKLAEDEPFWTFRIKDDFDEMGALASGEYRKGKPRTEPRIKNARYSIVERPHGKWYVYDDIGEVTSLASEREAKSYIKAVKGRYAEPDARWEAGDRFGIGIIDRHGDVTTFHLSSAEAPGMHNAKPFPETDGDHFRFDAGKGNKKPTILWDWKPSAESYWKAEDHFAESGIKIARHELWDGSLVSEPSPETRYSNLYSGGPDTSKFVKAAGQTASRLGRATAKGLEDFSTDVQKRGVKAATKSAAGAITKKVQDRFPSLSEVAADMGKSNLNVIRDSGAGGPELKRTLVKSRLDADARAGAINVKVKDLVKGFTPDEISNFVEMNDSGARAMNPKVQRAYDAWRKIDTEELVGPAMQSGISLRIGRGADAKDIPFTGLPEGSYWPRIYPPEFFKDKKNALEALMKGDKKTGPRTLKQAQEILNSARHYGERLIDPQHARMADVKGYRKDMDALYTHISDMATRIQQAHDFGPKDTADLKSNISQLIANTDQPARVTKMIEHYLGRNEPGSAAWARVSGGLVNFEKFAKLSHFIINNTANLAMTPLRANTVSFIKALKDVATDYPAATRQAEQSGALQAVLKDAAQELGSAKGMLRSYGIPNSERFMRTISSKAGRYTAESLFKKVKSGNATARDRARLDNLLLEDVSKQSTLTEEQLRRAGGRMSEITQGRAQSLDLPAMWTDHEWARPLMLYKRYAFTQSRHLKEAFIENPVRTGAFILGLFSVLGEGIGDVNATIKGATSAAVRGKDISEGVSKAIKDRGEGLDRLINDLSQAWSLGLLGDVMGSAGRGKTGILEFGAGPIIGDIAEIGGSIGSSTFGSQKWKKTGKDLGRFALGMTPIIGSGLRDAMRESSRPRRRAAGAF